MKQLTKIKLIHWHYFVNETVPVKNNILLTGENGAGKSTLLDAIQYVLTAGKAKFNTAAVSNTKRTLASYVRCKIGTDSKTYLREGDVTSHIALEFYDDETDNYFIVGCVIDVQASSTRERVLFYTIDNKQITDELYIIDNRPLNIGSFKRHLSNLKHQVEEGKERAKHIFLNRFGQMESKYIELLPKALAFRPLDDVKDFVYNFVLDEKEIKIETLRHNVRQYRELERLLEDTRKRIKDLEVILDTYQKMEHNYRNKNIKEFVIIRAEYEQLVEQLNQNKHELIQAQTNYDSLLHKQQQIDHDIHTHEKDIESMTIQLANNETYKRKMELDNRLNDLRFNLERLTKQLNQLNDAIAKAKRQIAFIHQQVEADESFEQFLKEANKDSLSFNPLHMKQLTLNVRQPLNTIKDRLNKEMHELDRKDGQLRSEISAINQQIKELQNKRMPYHDELILLKRYIEEDIQKMDPHFKALIFCELLEVKDEKWRNALEGYLNTQRFDLIVDPKYFDQALRIYEKVKKSAKIHGIGLVNVAKLTKYHTIESNSLASKVTTDIEYARYYANMLLNRVQCCETIDELKTHRTAITPSCMVYQNNTARQINEKVYQKPYIGKQAIEQQLKMAEQERKQLLAQHQAIQTQLTTIKKQLVVFQDDSWLYTIENNLDVIDEFKQNKHQINRIQEELRAIKDDPSIIDLQMQLGHKKTYLARLKSDKDVMNRQIGNEENKIKELKSKGQFIEMKIETAKEAWDSLQLDNPEYAEEAENEFFDRRSRDDYPRLFEKVKNRLDYYTREWNKQNEDLITLQISFNHEYQFGGGEGAREINAYQTDYHRLTTNDILKYEDNVRQLKEKTEIEFKEHFVARLRENIKEAQREFRQLNRALEHKKFGSDEYQFSYTAHPKYKKFYDMIMDDDNLEGRTLFTDSFEAKHNEAMNELFDKIVIDDEFAEQAMQQFTDYRTYMDYDIKIKHENGDTSTFSKVAREKSGGETQTPFYVIIAAAFTQVFNNANNPIGLVLFDEAFNNMDEGRIETMMEFYRQLNLQLIIAVPSQRMDTIQPYVETTLVVLRDNDYSFISNFEVERELSYDV